MSTAKIDKKIHHSHHFESQEQEYLSGKEGVWLFMATEIMMFGALFVAYFLYRALYHDAWVQGGALLDWKMGAFNTLVLLISSFTMAQAVTATMQGKNKEAFRLVVVTTLCAVGFLVVKYFEYTHKIHDGLFPGLGLWNNQYMAIPGQQLFFTIYFLMTGLHGIHILIGIGLMFWLMKRLKNDEFGPKYFTAVEGVGLYWHIVDVIWIYLFPLMYLI
jgi:cytochrome c oxidase subunit 3